MNIQIIKADVVKSAEAMTDIADALKKLDFAGPLNKLGSAMPGGETAGGSKKLASEWKDDQHGGWLKHGAITTARSPMRSRSKKPTYRRPR